MERKKTMSSSQSSIPLCIGNNYKRCVFTIDKRKEEKDSLKLLEVWNSHLWRKSLIGRLLSIYLCISLVLAPLPLVFILHLLQSKRRRQGGNVLHSYWGRTMVNRAKNSTHANGVQGAYVQCVLCPLANWYFVFFNWLECGQNLLLQWNLVY